MKKQHMIIFLSLVLAACGGDKEKNEQDKTETASEENLVPLEIHDSISPEEYEARELVLPQDNPKALLKIDLKQDISKRPLQEIRLLKNSLLAQYGYLFMQADLRGYFSANLPQYDQTMEDRFWAEDNGDSIGTIQLTGPEQAFFKKLEEREKELLANNTIERNGKKLANVENIVNLFQFDKMDEGFMQLLDKNNFAVVPANEIQHFHVYEKNDYRQVPNFVTTDMYLQLFHMYFSYTLKSLEKDKFVPALTTYCEGMYDAAMKTAKETSDPELKKTAEYNATFFAIGYNLLTGKNKTVPAVHTNDYKTEIANIQAQADAPSSFLQYTEVDFPYSLFKPRGHYTRKEVLKKYFRCMMWLQYAPFCVDKTSQLKNATFMAYLMNTAKTKSGKLLSEQYNKVYEPIVFLIGEPDNVSITDVCRFLKEKQKDTKPEALLEASVLKQVDAEVKRLDKLKNRIRPKEEVACKYRINLMPQRYLADNEILQELVDIKANAERAYPKGMDVFAAFGNKMAEHILLSEDRDAEKWKDFTNRLGKLQAKFKGFTKAEPTVYNKWLQMLLALQKDKKEYPGFMRTNAWAKKNLSTSLASWAELKHDAILYGEQPMAAECGDGGPPPPYTVGYVEPNTAFWNSIVDLMSYTETMLKKHGLLTDDLISKTKELKESAQFLLSASQKELKGEKLTEPEYRTIEAIGSSVEWLSLSIVDPGTYFDSWENVQGPDKSVAVVADIYTRNVQNCNKNGILHTATGNVNEIYVVVEIEGYLYLTKGAVFSYYEFVQLPGERLTDEEWQEKLNSADAPAIPQWVREIMYFGKEKPKSDEKIFYSSGC